jgi:hypothetical protein
VGAILGGPLGILRLPAGAFLSVFPLRVGICYRAACIVVTPSMTVV